MAKMSVVQKWIIIRDSLLELQKKTTKEGAKQPPKKKSVKRKKEN